VFADGCSRARMPPAVRAMGDAALADCEQDSRMSFAVDGEARHGSSPRYRFLPPASSICSTMHDSVMARSHMRRMHDTALWHAVFADVAHWHMRPTWGGHDTTCVCVRMHAIMVVPHHAHSRARTRSATAGHRPRSGGSMVMSWPHSNGVA
jgi:hypothetical protein